MAKKSVVTYEAVAEAMQALFVAGESTAFPAVYSKLGSVGSAKVVQGFMSRWKEAQRDKLLVVRRASALPEDLVSSADALVESVWLRALKASEAVYQQARGELALERSEMQAAVDAADELVASVERQVQTLQGELQVERARGEERRRQLEEQALRLAEDQVVLAEKDRQLVEQRETLAGLTALLESERSRHTAELAQVREQLESNLADLRTVHTQELQREREYSEGERQFVMRELDAARELAKRDATKAADEIAGLRVERDSYRGLANQARDAASSLTGKVEALDAEMTRLRVSQAAAAAEAASWQQQTMEARLAQEYAEKALAEAQQALKKSARLAESDGKA